MPTYVFKCPVCDSEVLRELPRKKLVLADRCHGGRGEVKPVFLSYVRTYKQVGRQIDRAK